MRLSGAQAPRLRRHWNQLANKNRSSGWLAGRRSAWRFDRHGIGRVCDDRRIVCRQVCAARRISNHAKRARAKLRVNEPKLVGLARRRLGRDRPNRELLLVEIVGGAATTRATIDRARAVLDAIGMKGVVIAREIEAFVGDRLLEALWREALWLIKDDICDVETLDNVIRYSFGLRWAQMGLFQTYRIAGGEAGMRHFLAQFGPCLKWPWTKLTDVVDLDEDLIEKIAAQSDKQAAGLSIRELERIRDENLVGILQALRGARRFRRAGDLNGL